MTARLPKGIISITTVIFPKPGNCTGENFLRTTDGVTGMKLRLGRILVGLIFFSLLAFCFQPAAARDAVVVPPGTTRYVAPNGNKLSTQLILVAEGMSLTEAIKNVNDGGTIEIVRGTYNERIEIRDINKKFTIKAKEPGTVFFTASGGEGIFYVKGGRPITIIGINFVNGYSNTNGLAGGLTIDGGEVTIINCNFSGNKGEQSISGGGALLAFNRARIFVRNSTFSNNINKNYGGAIAIEDESIGYVFDSQFIYNRVNPSKHLPTSAGGAIHVGNSILRVANSSFVGNQAGYVGGAIYAIGQWRPPYEFSQADVVIVNSRFEKNIASRDSSVFFELPTEAGAVHAEDQTMLRIFSSRFLENYAEIGGGVNGYRAKIEVNNSIFIKNKSKLFGGAISVTSNDTSVDGNNNRPSASLKITNSFIQGSGWGQPVGKSAGGIYISGDTNRMYGNNGVTQEYDAIKNRANLEVNKVVFVDLDTRVDETISHGGAIMADLSNVSISDSLFIHNRSVSGGAVSIIQDSDARINNCAFYDNFAQKYGGAVYLSGIKVVISNTEFISNSLSDIGQNANTSYGAALFTATMNERSLDIRGEVNDSYFSGNYGLPIYERDNPSTPINDISYNGNKLFTNYFSSQVFTNSNGGYCCKTTSELNNLIIFRSGSSSKKSLRPNQYLPSPYLSGNILAAPNIIIPRGESPSKTLVPAIITFYSADSSSELNGSQTVTGWGSYFETEINTYLLKTKEKISSTEVRMGEQLYGDVTIDKSASTCRLGWQISTNEFLDVTIDQGVKITPSKEGTLTLENCFATESYRLYVITPTQGFIFGGSKLELGSTPMLLVGLNQAQSERKGFLILKNSGDGLIQYKAYTRNPEIVEIIKPEGEILDNEVLEYKVIPETPGVYTAMIDIDAGSAGKIEIQLTIHIVEEIHQTFLPIILK
jgi:predicted outer membrane repeat protein